MKTLLKVNFDSYRYNTDFIIENPPFLPSEGECFSAKWEDYIQDQGIIDALNEYEDNGIFITNIVNKHYSREALDVVIVLVEEQEYKELFMSNELVASRSKYKFN